MSVATLRAGQEVEGIFACTRKDRLLSRGGTPYLAVELRDRTGAVQGRAFRDADVLGRRFERGDLVRASCTRAWTRTCSSPRGWSTTWARRASSPTARRSA